MRYASLPMYGEQELHPAIEQWWAGIARHLRDRGIESVPDALTWPDDLYALWRSPDLLFGQTCGHPLVHTLSRSLTIVATPHYDAPGCDGPHYRSLILVREDTAARSVGELREKSLAVSSTDSYSGYHVWRRILSGSRGATDMFGAIVLTGSHRASIRSVREGQAEVCAVDCVTHALLSDRMPDELAGTRILDRSPPAPALPFITGAATTQDELVQLRDGLFAALDDPSLAKARAALRLAGASVLTGEDYRQAFAG